MLDLAQPFKDIVYRSHDPRWSFEPTSGEGAARYGGRYNPKGQVALYLSLSQVGALVESQQGFPKRAHPKLLCSYDVDMQSIIDLTDINVLNQLNINFDELINCPWLLTSQKGKIPYTWEVFTRLYQQNINGIVVPSSRPEGIGLKNLVLWRWSGHLPNKISVIDPDKQLPLNQSSWL